MSKAKLLLVALGLAWPYFAVYVAKHIDDSMYELIWAWQSVCICGALIAVNIKNIMEARDEQG